MSAVRSSTSSSILPTCSSGTFRCTSGTVELLEPVLLPPPPPPPPVELVGAVPVGKGVEGWLGGGVAEVPAAAGVEDAGVEACDAAKATRKQAREKSDSNIVEGVNG